MPDRHIVLTGASGGIGLALTDYLLTNGAGNAVFQYRAPSDALFDVVRKHGKDPDRYCFRADLTSEQDVRNLRERVEESFGPAWGLINLAGSSSNGLSWKLSLAEFERVVNDNLTTTFLTCREFVPGMRRERGGRVINISSVVGFAGVAGAAHYCAAKAGVVGLTRAMARELAPSQVTANVLALGYFEYGMLYTIPEELREGILQQIPAGRFGSAVDIGAMITHLLGDDAGYITGQVIHINGGMYG
jgi:3-oxoacyl-[acyl-carrier protein] reductase